MKQTKTSILQAFATLALLFVCSFAQAQPDDPGPDPDPPPNNGIPFDGGLSVVIAAAIGYAAKKGVDKRRKNNNEQEQPVTNGE